MRPSLGGEGAAQTPRGLSNLDPNAANSGSRKRKAALPSGLPIRKARTAKALEMEASLKVVAEDEGAAEAEAAEAAEAPAAPPAAPTGEEEMAGKDKVTLLSPGAYTVTGDRVILCEGRGAWPWP